MPDRRPNRSSTLVLGTGELGMAVLRALAERRDAGDPLDLTVLLRPSTAPAASDEQVPTLKALGVAIVRADLAGETEARLAAIFLGFSTVICCTGFVGGPGTQRRITAAVLRAGVERYVPWQFGVDYDEVGRGSGQQVWDEQLDVRDTLRGQKGTDWIIVSTGMFTSFLFEPAFGVVDLANGRVNALGSWDHRVTLTTPEDIGRLTAAILFANPPIRNEVVYVAGDTLSYAELADKVDGGLGRTVERVLLSRDALASDVSANPADEFGKYRLAFVREDGVAWDVERTFNHRRGSTVTDVTDWIGQNLS